jgi:hypothetical protein
MSNPCRLPALLALPLAVLLAAGALGGILLPAVYAREHPHWAAQGLGQDWVDLVFAAPLLALSAVFTLRGSRPFTLLLAGALSYSLYSLVLYAFFMHFGPLFLVYTWALGLAFFALVGLVCSLRAQDVAAWFAAEAPVKPAGTVAVLLGAAYYVVWLSEVLPALASGAAPMSAVEIGFATNPVHVLDLGVVLPAFVVGGVALLRRRPLGYWLAPTMLGFGVVMDVALLGMGVSIEARGTGAAPPFAVLVVMLLLAAGALAGLLRRLAPAASGCRAPSQGRPTRLKRVVL